MDRDITIPYLDYRAMMDDIAEYQAIKHEMRYLLKTASYNKYREELEFKMDLGEFLDKFNADYEEFLKKEEEKENKE
jgi:hypothetical protein